MGLYMGDTNITFGLQGKDGENGVSPTISVSEITGGHQFTINDVNGSKSVDIMDGSDGRSLYYSLVHPIANPETGVYEYLVDAIVTNGNRTLQNGDYIFSKDDCCLYCISGYTGGDDVTVKLICSLKGEKGNKGEAGGTGATGETGQRGTGLLPITTAPSSYTTAVNGLTPAYRIALSTVKTQSGLTDVFVGDTIRYSYYHYPIIYVDTSYAYTGKRVSIRGASGAAGKTPVKGTDYFTDADKAEMVNAVKAALNSETWVFTLSGGTTVQKEVLLK